MGQTRPVALLTSTILLVLAIVLVVLTRLRLARQEPGAGRADIPVSVVNAHTVLGTLGIVVWGTYLFVDVPALVGVVGLVLWWATTVVGLLILARWLPNKGRHASDDLSDNWTQGPWLSMLGHLGALVGAVVWTAFFVAGAYTA